MSNVKTAKGCHTHFSTLLPISHGFDLQLSSSIPHLRKSCQFYHTTIYNYSGVVTAWQTTDLCVCRLSQGNIRRGTGGCGAGTSGSSELLLGKIYSLRHPSLPLLQHWWLLTLSPRRAITAAQRKDRYLQVKLYGNFEIIIPRKVVLCYLGTEHTWL